MADTSSGAGGPSELQVVEQRLGVEQNGINVIPEGERKGRARDLFWPWCAANIAVLGINYGAFILYFGVSSWQAMLAAAIGTIFSFLLVGFVSLAGKHASAPTMVISRAAFGIRGNGLPAFFSWLLLVGWETALVSLGTLATATVLDRVGWASGDLAKVLGFLIMIVLVIGAGVLGFSAIMRLQTVITIVTGVLTIGYILLTVSDLDFSAISDVPSGSGEAFLGAIVFAMTGFGLGWVNSGADYSRYLPRGASGKGIVGWTTFGASLPAVILVFYGILLCASGLVLDDGTALIDAIAVDPIGALTQLLPTWYLIPFIIVVLLGLAGGAVLDIYSSGLAMLTVGIRIPRWSAAAIDGLLMTIGTILVVFAFPDFQTAFFGFLYTLGVPIAAWAGIFLADMLLRRRDYRQDELYDSSGRYRSVNWVSVLLMLVGIFVGWGLVTNFNASWLTWQGYLLDPLGLGPKENGAWTYANIGILAALGIGFVGYLLLGRSAVRRQESLVD